MRAENSELGNSSPSVFAVVLNWNGAADTIDCVKSLLCVTYSPLRITVVDNGSTDDSVTRLRAAIQDARVELIETGRNLGYAGGNNVGMRHALANGAQFLLVLNNDTIVAPHFLDHLLGAAANHPRAGCFGPRILYMNSPNRVWFERAMWNDDLLSFAWPGQDCDEATLGTTPGETDYVCGAALVFRAEVASAIGLFDEQFFLVYEESDWCFRARRAGFGCLMVPTAKVWHKVGASFGSEASPMRTYFSTRNRLLWARRNIPASAYRRLVREAVRHLIPSFALGPHGAGFAKRFYWGATEFARNVRRRMTDPIDRAARRGLIDYLLGRFGDCPDSIRQLSREWAKTREAERAADESKLHAPA